MPIPRRREESLSSKAWMMEGSEGRARVFDCECQPYLHLCRVKRGKGEMMSSDSDASFVGSSFPLSSQYDDQPKRFVPTSQHTNHPSLPSLDWSSSSSSSSDSDSEMEDIKIKSYVSFPMINSTSTAPTLKTTSTISRMAGRGFRCHLRPL